jgi:hypothetical protein
MTNKNLRYQGGKKTRTRMNHSQKKKKKKKKGGGGEKEEEYEQYR